ncbi:uncharacterized protein J3D65DRAFT_636641 [Phyllosticta citribraziliensis]|uniref:Uncharacterized protein n=1 Tax=Phyllosticta citribraziliensis TaxID=989973 RepID=A0ABR1LCJ6_9PEZI
MALHSTTTTTVCLSVCRQSVSQSSASRRLQACVSLAVKAPTDSPQAREHRCSRAPWPGRFTSGRGSVRVPPGLVWPLEPLNQAGPSLLHPAILPSLPGTALFSTCRLQTDKQTLTAHRQRWEHGRHVTSPCPPARGRRQDNTIHHSHSHSSPLAASSCIHVPIPPRSIRIVASTIACCAAAHVAPFAASLKHSLSFSTPHHRSAVIHAHHGPAHPCPRPLGNGEHGGHSERCPPKKERKPVAPAF